jgi:geranylgeranyl transferase type-2 subunit beta
MPLLPRLAYCRFPDAARERHRDFIISFREPGGGFCGRASVGDLYYTRFALRALELLAEAKELAVSRDFLLAENLPCANVIDAFCLLDCCSLLIEKNACALEDFSEKISLAKQVLLKYVAASGGFAASPGGEASIYQTFLGALAVGILTDFQNCNESLTQALTPEKIAELLRERSCPGGGFVDHAGFPEGQTNPTAAAVALANLVGDETMRNRFFRETEDFLLSGQEKSGGWKSGSGATEADLLSTFAALTALAICLRVSRARLADAARFVRGCVLAGGGFAAAPGEPAGDAEYAYYGLAAAALLANEIHRR